MMNVARRAGAPMLWKKLALLVLVAALLVGLAAVWSSARRAGRPKPPALIPGEITIPQKAR
jgi:hypothetical protein